MELHVGLDEDTARGCDERGSPILCTLYWTHEGAAYPEVGWRDFGGRILPMWLDACRVLCWQTSPAEFPFVDGPYAMTLRRNDDGLAIRMQGSDGVWRSDLVTVLSEVARAAKCLADECGRLRIGACEREALLFALRGLEA